MENIIIYADSPFVSTGYSRIADKFAQWLKNEYNVYYVGIGYSGKTLSFSGYNLLQNKMTQVKHDFANKKFKFCIYIRNAWVFSQMEDPVIVEIRKLTDKIILYTPVEEEKLPLRFFSGYGEKYDKIWTMTKHSQEILKSYGYESDVLYHFFDENLKTDKFIQNENFLTISYSLDYRKNLGMIYEIAKLFDKNNFIISGKSFHFVLNDYNDIYKLTNMNYYYEVTRKYDGIVLPDNEIKQLYETSNFYLQPSIKEGFDLTVLETLTNGLITFMPDDPLHRELFYTYPNAIFVRTTHTYAGYNQVENVVLLDDWIEAITKNINKKKMGYRLDPRFSEKTIKENLFKLLTD